MINHNPLVGMFLYWIPGDYPTDMNPCFINSFGTIPYEIAMKCYHSGMHLSQQYENISILFPTVMKPYPSSV